MRGEHPPSDVSASDEERRAGPERSAASLATRVACYEALIADAESDRPTLESLVTERWPQPPDAIEWYYRGVALFRLGRREEALEAHARAAELAPPWAVEALPVLEMSPPPPESGRKVLDNVPPTPPEAHLSGSVVTLVGSPSPGVAHPGTFLAVDIHDPVPGQPPEGSAPASATPLAGAEADPGSPQSPGMEPQPAPVADAPGTPAVSDVIAANDEAGPEPLSGDGSGWYYRGVTLARMQRFEDALQAYEQAVRADDRNAAAWHYMGITLARLGRHAEALKAYASAIRLDDSNPAIRVNQAVSFTELGCHAQAQAAHDKALKLESGQEQRRLPAAPRFPRRSIRRRRH